MKAAVFWFPPLFSTTQAVTPLRHASFEMAERCGALQSARWISKLILQLMYFREEYCGTQGSRNWSTRNYSSICPPWRVPIYLQRYVYPKMKISPPYNTKHLSDKFPWLMPHLFSLFLFCFRGKKKENIFPKHSPKFNPPSLQSWITHSWWFNLWKEKGLLEILKFRKSSGNDQKSLE